MKTWVKWLLVGLLSVGFGAVVLSNTVIASISVTLMTGILFAAAGALQVIGGITDSGLGNKVWNVLLGVLMLFLGISFIAHPLQGTISLALLVTMLIGISGILRMFLAWQMRKTQYFWAMLISGTFSILLAGLILADFETISVQLLGLLLGLELIFNGVGVIVLAFFLRKHPALAERLAARGQGTSQTPSDELP